MEKLLHYTKKQTKLIIEYALTNNIKHSCRKAGVGLKKGAQFLRDDVTEITISECTNNMIHETEMSLVVGTYTAVLTAMKTLRAKTASKQTKLRAAELIMKYTPLQVENMGLYHNYKRFKK